MSINTVQSTTPFDQIARQLVDRFDANKDGQLTTEEFTSFLSNFLTSTATPNGAANGVANGVAAGAGLNVLDISKDQIKIKDDVGQEAWFDVIHAAGSGRARGWQFSDTRS